MPISVYRNVKTNRITCQDMINNVLNIVNYLLSDLKA